MHAISKLWGRRGDHKKENKSNQEVGKHSFGGSKYTQYNTQRNKKEKYSREGDDR